MRLLQRALRRSGLPLAYSQGYNPRLRLNLALPLPLGVTAELDYGELILTEKVDPDQLISRLSAQLPAGLELLGVSEVALESPSLAALVAAARYRAKLKITGSKDFDPLRIERAVNQLMAAEEILMPRSDKKKKQISYTNVRPYIFELRLDPCLQAGPELTMLLKAGSDGGVSPFFLLQQLASCEPGDGDEVWQWSVERESLYLISNGVLAPLTEGV
jgi:radical SAM-linked protein